MPRIVFFTDWMDRGSEIEVTDGDLEKILNATWYGVVRPFEKTEAHQTPFGDLSSRDAEIKIAEARIAAEKERLRSKILDLIVKERKVHPRRKPGSRADNAAVAKIVFGRLSDLL
ncbi:MAG TPA: hypothetical protein VJB99_01505 [Patescibacteria group bacterium]|nr:hypothetical protein [Patescibacteria group bacterium]